MLQVVEYGVCLIGMRMSGSRRNNKNLEREMKVKEDEEKRERRGIQGSKVKYPLLQNKNREGEHEIRRCSLVEHIKYVYLPGQDRRECGLST